MSNNRAVVLTHEERRQIRAGLTGRMEHLMVLMKNCEVEDADPAALREQYKRCSELLRTKLTPG